IASFAKTIARPITASVSTTPSIRIVQLSMRARTGAGNSLRVGTTAGMLKPFSKLPVQVRAKGPQARGSAIHSGFSQVRGGWVLIREAVKVGRAAWREKRG